MTALIVMLTVSPGCAQTPHAPTEPIQVMILVILATDKDQIVSEKIKEVAAVAREKDPTLTGFLLVNTIKEPIKMGGSKQFDLVGKTKVDVTVNAKTDDEGRVTLTIKPPKMDKITYSCTCGKFLPILTEHYTSDNKRLIIAIMAKPCKKK
jgi:hypothetical protein